MPVPTNKSELQLAIKTNYDKLKKDLSTVPHEQTAVKDMEGHGKGTLMSINDLLAYLVGWGELVLKWNKLKDNKEEVSFPESGFKWNELGLLAQKFYDDYKDDDFHVLMDKLNHTVEAILALIAKKSNHELYETPWYDKWTCGRMIQFNTSSPYANASNRIRKWKKENGLK